MFIAVGVSGGEMAIAVWGCQSVTIAGVRYQHSWIFTYLLSWCLLSLCEHHGGRKRPAENGSRTVGLVPMLAKAEIVSVSHH
jgi:hypothetical protein